MHSRWNNIPTSWNTNTPMQLGKTFQSKPYKVQNAVLSRFALQEANCLQSGHQDLLVHGCILELTAATELGHRTLMRYDQPIQVL